MVIILIHRLGDLCVCVYVERGRVVLVMSLCAMVRLGFFLCKKGRVLTAEIVLWELYLVSLTGVVIINKKIITIVIWRPIAGRVTIQGAHSRM